jgi:hypothetical protein
MFFYEEKWFVDRPLNWPAKYKLGGLIIERYRMSLRWFFGGYPKCVISTLLLCKHRAFIVALRDLDDCETMLHLFVMVPALEGEHVQLQRIHNFEKIPVNVNEPGVCLFQTLFSSLIYNIALAFCLVNLKESLYIAS